MPAKTIAQIKLHQVSSKALFTRLDDLSLVSNIQIRNITLAIYNFFRLNINKKY